MCHRPGAHVTRACVHAVSRYMAVQVCGHEGRPKLRIIDDSSPPSDVAGGDFEEEEEW